MDLGRDHELTENIVHLVLAKAPGGGPGSRGISLFIVPKFLPDGTRNDVALVGLNHKMGNRATTNTLLNFGDGTFSDGSTPGAVDTQPARSAPGAVDTQPARSAPGAVGYLVGEEHRGLSYMFHMMNEARIGVGFLATALGYAGYQASLEYAKVRAQGRPVDLKDPSSKPVPIIEHADVRRMLLAQKSYVEGALGFELYCSVLVDQAATATDADEKARLELLLEVLTPDREELAVAVVPGGQQPRHPGARRLRLHPRVRRRAVLPRQPPQPPSTKGGRTASTASTCWAAR